MLRALRVTRDPRMVHCRDLARLTRHVVEAGAENSFVRSKTGCQSNPFVKSGLCRDPVIPSQNVIGDTVMSYVGLRGSQKVLGSLRV